ncbi:MAG: CotH kinase family protein [Caldilineaceae bacterium]|nr:CotH kinase family protein [Caldilineaceae bacterium]MBP8106236.1 CotH kinase family protein [Caldilineaceae bacterium]MBP8121167.1 CotH kinase family protein [Caldilineaceae bacterium]MBP9071560.1 CotH kinase family protein [Caldilineaceae bacterium]
MKRKLITTILLLLLAAFLVVSCNSQDDQTDSPTVAPTALSAAVESTSAGQTTTVAAEPSAPAAETADTDEVARPEGWAEATHDNSADPDYATVFPDDEVNRLDITISAEDWAAMMADMATIYGAQGSSTAVGQGGRGGGARPAGALPAAGGQPGGLAPAGDPPAGAAPADAAPAGAAPAGAAPAGGGQIGRAGGVGGAGLETDTENPIWVASTVEFEGDVWTSVGIRFKGNSSLRSSWTSGSLKMPLKLDFDEFEDEYPEIDDQRFYGFKQLSLSSNYQDNSLMRETVAYDVFEEMGVVVPQTAFYEVYVDYGEGPTYFGLYTMVEVVDDTVIETNFDDDSGNVYKPEGVGSSFAAGSFNETDFDKETNGDEADYSDILALYDVLHSDQRLSDPAAWRTNLEAVFDVDTFLRWLATNTVIQNWDTYGVAYHNYYLYTNPTTGQITWIPWDNNESLKSAGGRGAILSLGLEEVGANWPLISYLVADEVYHAQYVDYVAQVAESAFNPDSMEATYQALFDLIRPYAVKEVNATAFDTAVSDLIAHADSRYAAVQSFLASQR